MADYRVLQNDPAYETELARRKYASSMFIAKLLFIVGLCLAPLAFLFSSKAPLALSGLALAFALVKRIQAAYVKTTFRL